MDREALKQIVIKQIKSGRTVDVGASGVSMMPMFWPKMTLRVKGCEPSELKRGDIVLFDMGVDSFIAHRVVRNLDGKVTMRGDSVMREDGEIRYENIVGIVTGATILGKMTSVRWWGARWYGRWVLMTSPVSHAMNHVCAKCLTAMIRIKNKILRKGNR